MNPLTAVLSLGLAGTGLWVLQIELPPALAASLLVPFAGLPPAIYTANVAVGSSLVTVVFLGWRATRPSRGP